MTSNKRDVVQRPVILKSGGGGSSIFRSALIVGGNTLSTGQDGIVYTSTISSVPSAYDPTVDTSFIDGVGRAYMYENGTLIGLVLVLNDGRGGAVDFDLLGGSDEPDTVRLGNAVSVAVGATTDTVSAYVVEFI